MSLDIKQSLGEGCSPFALARETPIHFIEVIPGQPAVIHLSDGSESITSCIHCHDQPCISYSDNEISSDLIGKFRVDSTNNVCATNAIKWSYDKSQPIITSEDCIFCGVCITRCPTQAIYLSAIGAVLSDEPQNLFAPIHEEAHIKTRQLIKIIPIIGAYQNESEILVTEILDRFKKLGGRNAKLTPNTLTRNLFRSLGVPAEAYPQGVQYSTVDVLLKIGELYGAVEVELTSAVIDVPRNLAGDVAVLIARHDLSKSNLVTFSVVGRLPQGREQYWMVVDDMERILDIKIKTISILALYLLVWARSNLNVQDDSLLLSEDRGISLRPFFKEQLGRGINLPEGFENQLEPSKLAE